MKPISFLVHFLKDFERGIRSRSTDYLAYELRELENIFSLLLLGSLIGVPSPPSSLSFRLFPHMLREIYVMGKRTKDADDVSGEIFGLFAP